MGKPTKLLTPYELQVTARLDVYIRERARCCFQALERFGDDVGIAFSGAEDVALVEYAHLTGRPFRVFRYTWQQILTPVRVRP